jgi:hypothetical protein
MGARAIVIERMETMVDYIIITYVIEDNGYRSPPAHIYIKKSEYSVEREKQELEKAIQEYYNLKKLGLLP